jgi:hypothetical protein
MARAVWGHRALAGADGGRGVSAARKSDLAYLVTGVLRVALGDNGGFEALGLRAVPELVAGVTTGRVVIEDGAGRRRLVVDVLDAPDA